MKALHHFYLIPDYNFNFVKPEIVLEKVANIVGTGDAGYYHFLFFIQFFSLSRLLKTLSCLVRG